MCTGQPSEARGGVGSWTSSQGGPGHAIHMESRRLTVLIRFLCTPRIQTCQYWALLFKVHSHIKYSTIFSLTSASFNCLVDQTVKNLSAMQETRVRPLGEEEPLKKGMESHSSNLAWRTPWTEETCGLHGITKSRTRLNDWLTHTALFRVVLVVLLERWNNIHFSVFFP